MYATDSHRPSVLFLGRTYAGHKTRFLNLQAHTQQDPRIRPIYRRVSGWVDNGAVERVPGLPAGIKGRIRGAIEGAGFARLPRPDVIWTSETDAVLPYLWSQWGRFRRPLVVELDWTLEQQEAFAPAYFQRPPKRGVWALIARMRERALWRYVTLFTPMSTWAADSLRRQGIPDERIRVLPPGLDLERWRPPSQPNIRAGGPLRLLFVGGDFARKGGWMLLDIFRRRFAGRCELDIVTREPVPSSPHVRIHRAEPNARSLRELYARADLFVLPTTADCFGHAAIEAMASGVPVLIGDVGGVRDIVDEGETGWLIRPNGVALTAALEHALRRRCSLAAMGRRARAVAEQRFDGRRNDALLVEILLEEAARNRSTASLQTLPSRWMPRA
jgi:glycosyltransferase involved in cell wall biosynthesis